MHSHMRFSFITSIAAASLMSSVALAQTTQPKAGSTGPNVTATTPSVPAANWMTQVAAGQWGASALIGLSVYNSDNERIGEIAELVVDRSGKIEAVIVGAGGFLGIGERDVAIPYGQISWSFQAPASPRTSTSTASPTTGAATTTKGNAEGPRSYPDHAVLNMTKDQLKAAPAFKFSR